MSADATERAMVSSMSFLGRKVMWLPNIAVAICVSGVTLVSLIYGLSGVGIMGILWVETGDTKRVNSNLKYCVCCLWQIFVVVFRVVVLCVVSYLYRRKPNLCRLIMFVLLTQVTYTTDHFLIDVCFMLIDFLSYFFVFTTLCGGLSWLCICFQTYTCCVIFFKILTQRLCH